MNTSTNSNPQRQKSSSLARKDEHGNSRTLTHLLIGPARDIHDPDVFHRLSLVAFLAWVGLGSDGLSSSCYGPEEAFLALGHHQYLAVFLAMLMALTVFVISASYSQTIDLFPTGGGGYLVASKLLGRYPGVISGSALVVDYVLTVSISIASGADAIFSFLPVHWLHFKLIFCIAIVMLMVAMNLRGIKESVMALLPIFAAFVVVHVFMITYAFITRAGELPMVARDAIGQVREGVTTLGALPLAIIFLRAYSLGGGTYTGIEAVSNGLPILREPRTVTGKRTMLYMALSLAFIAGGILIGYLLFDVSAQPGKTLNAVLFYKLAGPWRIGGFPIGNVFTTFALLTEGALLFVAAQTGFLDGPRVLATMANDRWLPRRFSYLSNRLVTQDGVVAMGLSALVILLITEAKVEMLVVLYAINVFLTFTLSQLGMSVHWLNSRTTDPRWMRKLMINGLGCLFTAAILVVTTTLKFWEGGWVTVLMTSGVIAFCMVVHKHYAQVGRALERLEVDVMPELYAAEPKAKQEFDPHAPTAVILVSGFNGLGLSTVVSLMRLFGNQFRNMVFVSVGEVDSALFKSHQELETLERSLADDLEEYSHFASNLGFHSEVRLGLGTDVVLELRRLCLDVAREFPHSVFFAGKLVFERDNFFNRFLHNQTVLEIQSWLQFHGLSLVILPVRVSEEQLAAAS
jgi:amino acid transporter